MAKISVEQQFNAPLADVFSLLSKHDTYNQMFWPAQVVRVQDAAEPNLPDGLGSIRRLGFGAIKPLQEQITKLEENQVIEYQLIHNPLVKHHLGRLVFQAMDNQTTLVKYSIELEGKIPFLGAVVAAQLKPIICLGMRKLAKNYK